MCKAIFSGNSVISKNAYLNWRTSKYDIPRNLFVLGESYSNSAIALMKLIIEDNKDKKADSLIFPILYSIDQSIELYIKAILREIETLNGSIISNYSSHDIKLLLDTLVGAIKKKDSGKGLENYIRPLNLYIKELYQKISSSNSKGKSKVNMDFARYPIDTEGNPHFYVDEIENVVIDVENLLSRFLKIKDILEGMFMQYEDELENMQNKD